MGTTPDEKGCLRVVFLVQGVVQCSASPFNLLGFEHSLATGPSKAIAGEMGQEQTI